MTALWITGTSLIILFMISLWALYYKKTNAGVIDIGWAFCFVIAGSVALLFGDAGFSKKIILALMVYPWSLRLVYYLWSRFDKAVEDPRYTKIKEGWGSDPSGIKFLGMFVFQAILASIIALPIYFIANEPSWGFLLIGFIIVTIGWIGEAIADYQMQEFKAIPSNKGKIMDQGLWGLSRHPNYFFEWLVWVGFTISAIWAPYSYLSLISLGIISYLLMGLSGVRLTEEHLAESRGAEWKKYKERVPPFFPRLFS